MATTTEQRIEGAFLAAALTPDEKFIGVYALAQEATYLRGAGTWIRAKGSTLSKLHGARLVELEKSSMVFFDRLEAKGETPTTEDIAALSTSGNPASWDTIQARKAAQPVQ